MLINKVNFQNLKPISSPIFLQRNWWLLIRWWRSISDSTWCMMITTCLIVRLVLPRSAASTRTAQPGLLCSLWENLTNIMCDSFNGLYYYKKMKSCDVIRWIPLLSYDTKKNKTWTSYPDYEKTSSDQSHKETIDWLALIKSIEVHDNLMETVSVWS